MKNTHTPGPWAAEKPTIHFSDRPELWQIYSHGDSMIAQVAMQDPQEDGGRSPALEEANARLIASAPDLLACLVAATLEIESLRKASKEAIAGPSEIVALSRAAIAKATQT